MSVAINLAHCYLFKNEYDKAIKLYSEHLNKEIAPNFSIKETIKQDFVFFKKIGFDTSLMKKVFTELKLEMPIDF